jgi:diguanylate cyclase
MMSQGETLGILYLDTGPEQTASKVKPLTEAQERTVKTLTEHLALAVANLNLRESLRKQAIRDPLTGLFNRRYMEESLEREFRRASRRESPLAILMIDIDHFKRLNDSFGHEAGDAVLRELAKVFQAQLRAEDIASRYGGEEFVLILPESDMAAASECADRLQQAVHAMQIQHYGRTLEGISLSIGLTCFPQQGKTVDSLMRTADAALYRAKENGRDRVEIA